MIENNRLHKNHENPPYISLIERNWWLNDWNLLVGRCRFFGQKTLLEFAHIRGSGTGSIHRLKCWKFTVELTCIRSTLINFADPAFQPIWNRLYSLVREFWIFNVNDITLFCTHWWTTSNRTFLVSFWVVIARNYEPLLKISRLW